jgi:hypothetical protein
MARKPTAHPIRSTQPYLDHETLTQDQQARHLGVKQETTMNLGHPVPVSRLTENPLGRMQNYDSADTTRTFRDPPRLQGVYRKTADPRSGISSADNLKDWSQRSTANSYTGHGNKAGTGKEPTVRDPRGSTVPSAARNKDSDGYLASPKDWSSYEYGSEAGLGRLEKSKKY